MNPINPLTGSATVDKKGGISVESAWQLWAELWARQSPQPLGEYKDQPDGFRVAWFDFLSNITYRLRETACDYRVVMLEGRLTEANGEIKRLTDQVNKLTRDLDDCDAERDRDDDIYDDDYAPRRRKPAKKAANKPVKKRAPAKRKAKKGTK